MNTVSLISVTPKAEEIIAYCARVSNPQNQDNPDSDSEPESVDKSNDVNKTKS